jgi:hypothetical protein
MNTERLGDCWAVWNAPSARGTADHDRTFIDRAAWIEYEGNRQARAQLWTLESAVGEPEYASDLPLDDGVIGLNIGDRTSVGIGKS